MNVLVTGGSGFIGSSLMEHHDCCDAVQWWAILLNGWASCITHL
jgi:dTDP-D-glucose 4,6-dehydratase